MTIEPIGTVPLEVGEIVALRGPGTEALVIHRIVKSWWANGRRWMQTKGDANACLDEPIEATRALGRVVLVEGVPFAPPRATSISRWRAASMRLLQRLEGTLS